MRSLKHYFLRAKMSLSKKDMFNYAYYVHRKKMPNYKLPSDLSEFILSESLKGNINNYAKYADKYEVRKYINEKGFGEILVDLLGMYRDLESVSFNNLPEKYVIKLNNGCGFNIVNYGININIEESKEKLKNWFKKTNYKYEEHYNLIEPVILIEEFIQDINPKLKIPRDYKFMCFKGKVKCILVCDDRNPETGAAKLYAFDKEWNRLHHYLNNSNTSQIDKPKNLEKMISIAEKLSEDFPFVRVDLYDSTVGIKFSELTFTPAMGIMAYFTDQALKEMYVDN